MDPALLPTPVLSYNFEPEADNSLSSSGIRITSSTLTFFCVCFDTPIITAQIIAWDWITGEVLLVRCASSSSSPLMQIVRQELLTFNSKLTEVLCVRIPTSHQGTDRKVELCKIAV